MTKTIPALKVRKTIARTLLEAKKDLSVREIARRLDVSAGTVSNVINSRGRLFPKDKDVQVALGVRYTYRRVSDLSSSDLLYVLEHRMEMP
jgi:predicted transcriptional regulator